MLLLTLDGKPTKLQQRGIALLSLIPGLVYRALIKNYVLLSIEIVFVCLFFFFTKIYQALYAQLLQ